MIAGGACCTSARGPKGLKPTKQTQAKPGAAPKPQRRNLCDWRSAGISDGLHKAEYEGTNALSSAAAVGGRLRRIVRPEGQKGAPKLKDGCGPGKSAGPRERRNAARMIAGGAYCTSAGGQKGLKLAQCRQAKPGAAPKPQRRNL